MQKRGIVVKPMTWWRLAYVCQCGDNIAIEFAWEKNRITLQTVFTLFATNSNFSFENVRMWKCENVKIFCASNLLQFTSNEFSNSAAYSGSSQTYWIISNWAFLKRVENHIAYFRHFLFNNAKSIYMSIFRCVSRLKHSTLFVSNFISFRWLNMRRNM